MKMTWEVNVSLRLQYLGEYTQSVRRRLEPKGGDVSV